MEIRELVKERLSKEKIEERMKVDEVSFEESVKGEVGYLVGELMWEIVRKLDLDYDMVDEDNKFIEFLNDKICEVEEMYELGDIFSSSYY